MKLIIKSRRKSSIWFNAPPCRRRYGFESRRDRFDEFGQGLIFTRQYRIVLPHPADGIQIRDIWTTTSSDDTQLIGREMEVRDVMVGTIVGYRSLTVHDFRE